MVGTGILSNNMRSLSPECYTTFWMMTIFSDNLHWSGTTPIFDPITDLDLITEFVFLPNCERFPWSICNGCGMPTEEAYSSGHLVLSHFGTCMCSNVETNISWPFFVSGLLSFEHPSVLVFLVRKTLLLRCIHHFKSELIGSIDRMRISVAKMIQQFVCHIICPFFISRQSLLLTNLVETKQEGPTKRAKRLNA